MNPGQDRQAHHEAPLQAAIRRGALALAGRGSSARDASSELGA
jgi:hypothetical protein